ncbi:hypothetical protein GCM10009609_42640 [Pseudonocardia aurantiaca]
MGLRAAAFAVAAAFGPSGFAAATGWVGSFAGSETGDTIQDAAGLQSSTAAAAGTCGVTAGGCGAASGAGGRGAVLGFSAVGLSEAGPSEVVSSRALWRSFRAVARCAGEQ